MKFSNLTSYTFHEYDHDSKVVLLYAAEVCKFSFSYLKDCQSWFVNSMMVRKTRVIHAHFYQHRIKNCRFEFQTTWLPNSKVQKGSYCHLGWFLYGVVYPIQGNKSTTKWTLFDLIAGYMTHANPTNLKQLFLFYFMFWISKQLFFILWAFTGEGSFWASFWLLL